MKKVDPMIQKNERETPVRIHQDVHSIILQDASSSQRSFCSSDLQIGSRLRAFRKQKGLNIRSLAEKCGISVNTLSLIENDRTYPNVYTLKLLADGLEIPVVSFFEGENPEPLLIYQQQGQRLKIPFSNGTLEKLGQGLPSLGAEPILVTLETITDEIPMVSHIGREFIYCLEGAMTCEIAYKPYPLFTGDSLLFNAASPHRWINAYSHPSKMLVLFCTAETHEQPAELHWKS